jgi:hypothetical protein
MFLGCCLAGARLGILIPAMLGSLAGDSSREPEMKGLSEYGFDGVLQPAGKRVDLFQGSSSCRRGP